ncbi:MAG TPA: hypothetical protein VLF43_04000 [Candidatus Saccharimonadales bacterium]|nr:hypothetical protein [Candidatus Saccharimonadales bacterium]
MDDFIILGPTLAKGNKVLDAVRSLYYLPDNYRLVFTDAEKAENAVYNAVMALVEHYELGSRVEFTSNPEPSHAVILPHPHQTRAKNSVAGNSPEALASAILRLGRRLTPSFSEPVA